MVLDRFMSKVEKTNSCWEWKAGKNKDGYGVFSAGGKALGAHRVAYGLFKPLMLSRDICVCHSCDNPGCVNPDHLFHGSHSENQQDKARKGRQWNQKLYPDDVILIRERLSRGELQKDIAKDYGVTFQAISFIANGVSWAHIV